LENIGQLIAGSGLPQWSMNAQPVSLMSQSRTRNK
jgi:hypothetical protein